MCHACMPAELQKPRHCSWRPAPACGHGFDHLRAWVHAGVWCKPNTMHIKAAKPCARPRPAPLLRLWVVPESSRTKATPIRLHHRHRGWRRHLHEGVHVCDISICSLHAKAVPCAAPRLHGRGRWIRGPPRLLPSILTGMHALLHVYHDTDDGDPVALLLDRNAML